MFASVALGVPTGVTLKIKVIRSSQSYIFPIHLSEDIVPAALFYATITPLLAWFVIKKTVVEPMNAENRQRKLEKIREANKQRIAEKRREAEAAVELMATLYERVYNEERERRGLVIVSARYGKFDEDEQPTPTPAANGGGSPASTPDSSHASAESWSSAAQPAEQQHVDVTLPLQCLVRDGRLRLQKGSKAQLPGFYDPCIGDAKVLRVDYEWRDVRHSVEVRDEQEMRLPQGE